MPSKNELRSLQNTLLICRLTKFLRETRSAIVIQKTWRSYCCRRDYLEIRDAVVTIQAFTRGMWGRQHFTDVLREKRATTIQRYCRGWQARTWYGKTRRAIILLQCCVRRMAAKKELKQLKVCSLYLNIAISILTCG